jgi:hypothetical protein
MHLFLFGPKLSKQQLQEQLKLMYCFETCLIKSNDILRPYELLQSTMVSPCKPHFDFGI